MKIMSTWSGKPGTMREGIQRFLAGQGTPPEGVETLGRWHAADFSCGFTLSETDNPVALYENAAKWADVLDIKGHVVIEDAEAGPILARIFGK
jgi:hypothetical protein